MVPKHWSPKRLRSQTFTMTCALPKYSTTSKTIPAFQVGWQSASRVAVRFSCPSSSIVTKALGFPSSDHVRFSADTTSKNNLPPFCTWFAAGFASSAPFRDSGSSLDSRSKSIPGFCGGGIASSPTCNGNKNSDMRHTVCKIEHKQHSHDRQTNQTRPRGPWQATPRTCLHAVE